MSDDNKKLPTRKKEKVLECAVCYERFPLKAIKDGKYFPSTGVCLACYQAALRDKKKKDWCFGTFDGVRSECKAECADRKICRTFSIRS